MLGISRISNFARKCLSFSKTSATVAESAAKATPSAPKITEAKDLFCHQYWAKMQEKGYLKEARHSSVDMHGYLNGINHHFITSPNPKHMDLPAVGIELTPREMITLSDVQFKALKPTTEAMTVYRGIGEKPDFFSEYKLYKQRLGIKKGDVIDMKEYAYATSDKSYAQVYMPNNSGIMYEIEVPKGARVSQQGSGTSTDEIVFPRSSKFECTGTERIKDENNDYLKVKLKYLLPNEPWRTLA